MIYVFIVIAGLCVAYSNGANDNFKGVATLFGSGTTDYRRALWWATGATLLGSVAAFLLAGNLIKSFGGKGLVDDAIAMQPAFAASVGIGAAVTIFVATRIGMPVSTTHGLIGALIGTGLMASSSIDLGNLMAKFLIPLLLSPILAIVATALVYPGLRFLRIKLGVSRDDCICVGKESVEVLSTACQTKALERVEFYSAKFGKAATCESRYQGEVIGISAAKALDRTHFLSAGILSFARGLNDTPKIAALLLLAPAMNVGFSLILIGIVIAIGGLVSARRVAETMSHRITTMNHGQGTTANVVSGAIVIGASCFGVPVSTTHVSCGSLFGIGADTGGARVKTIASILLAWLTTLPLAALLACVCYSLLQLI